MTHDLLRVGTWNTRESPIRQHQCIRWKRTVYLYILKQKHWMTFYTCIHLPKATVHDKQPWLVFAPFERRSISNYSNASNNF